MSNGGTCSREASRHQASVATSQGTDAASSFLPSAWYSTWPAWSSTSDRTCLTRARSSLFCRPPAESSSASLGLAIASTSRISTVSMLLPLSISSRKCASSGSEPHGRLQNRFRPFQVKPPPSGWADNCLRPLNLSVSPSAATANSPHPAGSSTEPPSRRSVRCWPPTSSA